MKVLERLLLAHMNKQIDTFHTHCSFLIVLGLELKMPSYTYFKEPTVISTKQVAMWGSRDWTRTGGSCSLISPVHVVPSSLHYYIRISRRCKCMRPHSPGFLTTWQTNHILWDWMVMCLPGGQQPRSTLWNCTLTIPLHPYTSDFQYKSASCHVQKDSDDSGVVVGFISDGQQTEYWELVDHFVVWCGDKTKEIFVDFRRTKNMSCSISIMREDMKTWWRNINTYFV